MASLASPVQTATKPETTSRLRRKLQKGGPRQKSYLAKRPGSGLDGGADECMGNKFDTAVKLVSPQVAVIPHPAITLPPDLSDSKWLEYIRKSGLLCAVEPSAECTDALEIPYTIPELSHLALGDAEPRISLESMSTESSASSNSTVSTMRRRAKTPVFSIGQLEGGSFGRHAASHKKTSSVELIADQYRALLGSGDDDADSIYSEALSEPAPSRLGFRDGEHELPRQHSSDALRTGSNAMHDTQKSPNGDFLAGSPTSDDGTLVSFEEETVYFKPVSFSPEPMSPMSPYESRGWSPQPAPDNLSLQICLDLLTRELSSAIADRPRRVGHEASALQIWVMIEAYERLRDQVADMRLQNDETRGVELMFDTWLGALYAIHDSIAGDARGFGSDDEVALFGEPLD